RATPPPDVNDTIKDSDNIISPALGVPLVSADALPAPPAAPRARPADHPLAIVARSVKAQDDASGPIRAISMKTPGTGAAGKLDPTPPKPMPVVKLRAMSEVASGGAAARPENLGFIAPPYDPRENRQRRAREIVIWACVCVILASGIALAIWFIGR